MENNKKYAYGVVVIGPSGSGKTTFCYALSQFFTAIQRKHVIVNMDPANETMSYETGIDIKDLIQIEDVMSTVNLGPNGALRYCMAFINKNITWLFEKMGKVGENPYFIFDFPGQIELYMNDDNLKEIIQKLQSNAIIDVAITSVSLFDCLCCYDCHQYISTSILSLISQIHLETPHVNVLTKIDLLKEYGKLPYRLSMYFDNEALNLMVEELENDESEFGKRYHKLNEKMRQVVMGENLISFFPLYITDKMSVCRLVALIDKANGFYYYKENTKEKFADIRDAIFCFDEFDNEEMMMSLEEEVLDHYAGKEELDKNEYSK